MPDAATQVAVSKASKHTVDFVCRGRIFEMKSGSSISKSQLKAIARYARDEGLSFVYVFLTEPPKSVTKQIVEKGGNVMHMY